MMPTPSTTGSNSSPVQPGTFPFPPYPFFAPPATMAAQQQAAVRLQQEANSQTQSAAPPKTQTLASATSSTSAPQVQKSRASTTTVSSGSAAPISSSQVSTSSQKTSESSSAGGAVESTPSATPTTSVPQSATTPEIRQRSVGQHSSRPPQGQFQNAAVPSDQNVRQSEHPLVILLMVVLGIAILALLVRRVYMMNTWRFDTDF